MAPRGGLRVEAELTGGAVVHLLGRPMRLLPLAAEDEPRRPHKRLLSADDGVTAEERCGRKVIVGRWFVGGGGGEVWRQRRRRCAPAPEGLPLAATEKKPRWPGEQWPAAGRRRSCGGEGIGRMEPPVAGGARRIPWWWLAACFCVLFAELSLRAKG